MKPLLYATALTALIGSALCAPAQETLYVIRHSEKAGAPDDPPLTDTGRTRAAAWATMLRTRFAGMAKPIPFDPPPRVRIAVLIPTSRPCTSTNAPPELPGLIAASVWMK